MFTKRKQIIARQVKHLEGLTNMKFNTEISLYQNVKMGLMVNGSSFKKACEAIDAKQSSVKERLHKQLVRNGKSTPLDKQIFDHMQKHCSGFKEYCEEKDIRIVS